MIHGLIIMAYKQGRFILKTRFFIQQLNLYVSFGISNPLSFSSFSSGEMCCIATRKLISRGNSIIVKEEPQHIPIKG